MGTLPRKLIEDTARELMTRAVTASGSSLTARCRPSTRWCSHLTGIVIRPEAIQSARAHALIAALNAELSARYPEDGATHFRLDVDEVAPGRGAFLVAHVDGEAVGCGAIRRLDGDMAEIKRMYVRPAARGRGVGGALLAALESEAHRLGVTRLVLETGERQPEALALYRGAGFVVIPAFGEYVDSPLSVCMGKELATSRTKSTG
ncbi:MAG: GNAT family N-acetyltransferase [Candidatus Rokuibacteriota bacterium]